MLRKLQVLVLGFGFAVGAVTTVGCDGAKDKATGPVVSNNEKMKESMKKTGEAVKDLGEKGKEVVKDAADKGKEVVKDAADKGKEVAGKVGNKIQEGADKAKETYLKPLNETLSSADTEINKLADQEKTATGDAKKVISGKVAKAKELMSKIKDKIKDLGTAAGDKWESVKAEIEKMIPELKTTLGLK